MSPGAARDFSFCNCLLHLAMSFVKAAAFDLRSLVCPSLSLCRILFFN
ncbi:unnamed protein product [Arabidopsis lyrata]|nr:unnamed protein product [Arabidopsis lyrata]